MESGIDLCTGQQKSGLMIRGIQDNFNLAFSVESTCHKTLLEIIEMPTALLVLCYTTVKSYSPN